MTFYKNPPKGFPFPISYKRKNGGWTHVNRSGIIWATIARRTKRRKLYLMWREDGQQKAIWLNIAVIKSLIRWLEEEGDNPLRCLSKKEKQILWGGDPPIYRGKGSEKFKYPES